MHTIAYITYAIRALHRPAAGPPETIEPAAAGTAGGFGSEALEKAFRTVSLPLARLKRSRARGAVRQRRVLKAVIRDQRKEVADDR